MPQREHEYRSVGMMPREQDSTKNENRLLTAKKLSVLPDYSTQKNKQVEKKLGQF